METNQIRGILVTFFREATKGDYLEALNKADGEIFALIKAKIFLQPDVSGNEVLRVAVAFADWIYRNDWEKFPTDIAEGATITHTTRWYNKGNERFTTEQLYDEFQKAKV